MAAVFADRWRRLRRNWKRVAETCSRDEVHDLRVAVRRFLAMIDVSLSLERKLDPEKCRRALKSVLEASSTLRDIQVERQWIAKSLSGNPELSEFNAEAADRESKELKDFRKFLKKHPKPPDAVSRARAKISKFLDSRRREETRDAAIVTVDRHYRRLTKRLSKVSASDMKSIHRARVALKQFRYSAEIARPLAGKRFSPRFFLDLRKIQSHTGRIQDIEVLLADLKRWTGKSQTRGETVKEVVERLEADRQRAALDFTEDIGRISSLWRAPL